MARFEMILSSKRSEAGNVLPGNKGKLSHLKAALMALFMLCAVVGLVIAAVIVGSIIAAIILILITLVFIAVMVKLFVRRIRS
jgi:uncharacterized protein (DUF2062 family)